MKGLKFQYSILEVRKTVSSEDSKAIRKIKRATGDKGA